ncbi:MAG: molecular chaperone Tir [Frankiales bacterium]|nr:molecular chaperone Tir [Frankiales bacterium]
MSYRNKTYVAFASEDISQYRMMEAWRDNDNIDFGFYDAHDLNVSRDSSNDETIRANLRKRMSNAKQFVLLGSAHTRRKGGDVDTFLGYEVKTMLSLDLPIVIANLGPRNRAITRAFIPQPLLDADYYTLSVSFQPKIIMHALDKYAPQFAGSAKSGPHYYEDDVYERLGRL